MKIKQCNTDSPGSTSVRIEYRPVFVLAVRSGKERTLNRGSLDAIQCAACSACQCIFA